MSVDVIRVGATKPNPFTIAVVANPALERYWNGGTFVVDPILARKADFDAAVQYLNVVLFGGLPGQVEQGLNDPTIAPYVRMVAVYDSSLTTPQDSTSLVAEDDPQVSRLLIPRRSGVVAFLARYGIDADVVFAVSASEHYTRASAYYTSDDDSRSGVPFNLDGVGFVHRFHCLIPGMAAIHCTANSMTGIHEFGHAISSYTNGSITDLYVDSNPALNCRRNRPIPPDFAAYDGAMHRSDLSRDSISYPAGWTSYHCALANSEPALMDNFWLASSTPESCCHDTITKRFILDRVRAKVAR